MSIDPTAIRRALAHGPFVRILVAGIKGSTPREAGTAMFVWPDGRTQGTIGGGRLEYDAIALAQRITAPCVQRMALGPDLGQCCGGAVTLAFEPIIAAPPEGRWYARPVSGGDIMPLSVVRALARARDRGEVPPLYVDGWLIEPTSPDPKQLWVWGAGHVGRAVVNVMAPLEELCIRWADTAQDRFPEPPPGVETLVAENPADLVSLAPADARHLIMTFSHALDLELCHRLLHRGFAGCGLIGSDTKWARFRSRLRALGHSEAAISRITCPIGDPALGKAPQAIAISVAAGLLKELRMTSAEQAVTGGRTA